MVRILMIHNTGMSAEEYRGKLFKKFPILAQHPTVWHVDILKFGRKMTKVQRTRKYDSLYYDEPTVSVKEIVDYITVMGHPQIIPVNISKPILTRGKVGIKRTKNIAYTASKKITYLTKAVKKKK